MATDSMATLATTSSAAAVITITTIRIGSVIRTTVLAATQSEAHGNNVGNEGGQRGVDDNTNYRRNFQSRNSGNGLSRNNSNRYENNSCTITVQEVEGESSARKALLEARKRFLESYVEETGAVTIENDKLVYVCVFLFPNR